MVPEASAVALVGPGGSGKSTLLQVASGLLRPGSGRVVVGGVDMTGRGPQAFSRLGVHHLPQRRAVFPSLTVRENLALQGGRADGYLDDAVRAFPVLGRRLRQVAGTLSGGEQRMLALARVAAGRPRLVLLDEVSLGLAPKALDQVYGVLADVVARGAAVVVVEQYLARALGFADYVYLLKRGAVAFSGEPAEVEVSEVFTSYVGGAFAPSGLSPG